MTDEQALDVLGALADVPLAWLQPGVRFRYRNRQRGGKTWYAGTVLTRDGDHVTEEYDDGRTPMGGEGNLQFYNPKLEAYEPLEDEP